MILKTISVGKEMKVGENAIKCKQCGVVKKVKPSLVKRGAKFCSYDCYWESKKGGTSWNKGLIGFMAGEKHWCWGKKREDVARENHWKWNGGIKTYRIIVDESKKEWVCERCGEVDESRLIVHHKDGDRYNNKIINLEVLCYVCHCAEHKHFNRWGEYENHRD